MYIEDNFSPENFRGMAVFFVGIKGTGMSALADLFFKAGARVSGSDIPEEFYTDLVLQQLGIPYCSSFDAKFLPSDTQLVVHSSAYKVDENPQLVEAVRRGIPFFSYSKALGLYSSRFFSCGIAGVHGKTTTTGLCGAIMKSMELEGSVLVGSALPLFDNRSIWCGGDHFFVAETCEYQRHFLDFHPSVILLTSSEADHLDYFRDEADVDLAFVQYCRNLPDNGVLIFCADDSGASRCAALLAEESRASGKKLQLIPYGFGASGDFQVTSIRQEAGRSLFCVALFEQEFEIRIPGRHLVQNAAGAIALLAVLAKREGISLESLALGAGKGLLSYTGSRRRCEFVGEAGGILILDDYAHHPTAIGVTLAGYKEFYPDRRLIVDFMSHTYSRTEGLLEEFAGSFGAADVVLLNKIYASAREARGNITGRTLFERTVAKRDNVFYFDEYLDALPWLLDELKPGDVFITMGAGDNWQLGRAVLKALKGETK